MLTSLVSTAQKMKFSIKNFFSKCDQIRSYLWIWPHLLNKSLMENFVFVKCFLQQGIVKKSKKLMKMVNIKEENLHIF